MLLMCSVKESQSCSVMERTKPRRLHQSSRYLVEHTHRPIINKASRKTTLRDRRLPCSHYPPAEESKSNKIEKIQLFSFAMSH